MSIFFIFQPGGDIAKEISLMLLLVLVMISSRPLIINMLRCLKIGVWASTMAVQLDKPKNGTFFPSQP
jgi:hypothetical protein